MQSKNTVEIKKQRREKLKKYLAIIGFILFIVFLLIINRTQKNNKNPSPTSTPEPGINTLTDPQYKLNIPDIHPKSGTVAMAQTRTSISLFFTKEIDPRSIKITTNPYIEFEVKTNPDFPDRIILEPKTAWVEGSTYKITINKGLRTLIEGLTLQEDIKLEYKIIKAERPAYTKPS